MFRENFIAGSLLSAALEELLMLVYSSNLKHSLMEYE
jgi:hypothetical protein